MKIQKFFAAAFLLITLSLASACAGDGRFSLTGSKGVDDLDSCLVMLKKKKYDDSVKCLESYRSRHAGEDKAADADLAIADSYFYKKDWIVAAEAYNVFLTTYPAHDKVPLAYFRSGLCYLKQLPKSVDRDQAVLDNAVKALGAVVDYYPSSPFAEEAKNYYKLARYKQAKKNFYVGRFYMHTKQYLAAIPRFETVINEFPGVGLDGDSFYYLVYALVKTNQKELARKYIDAYRTYNPDDEKNFKRMSHLK